MCQILGMVVHETSISIFWLICFNPRVHSVVCVLVYENCSKKGMFKSNVRVFLNKSDVSSLSLFHLFAHIKAV